MGGRGGLEGILYILFSLLMFFPLRWHKKEWGPLPRARDILPHNLPKYFDNGYMKDQGICHRCYIQSFGKVPLKSLGL